jgi:hypothetical protein
MFNDLMRQGRRMDSGHSNEIAPSGTVSTNNVSSPPTDAELDTVFGTAANLPEGFSGFVDDNGAGTTVWYCVAINSAWWYTQLTKAV